MRLSELPRLNFMTADRAIETLDAVESAGEIAGRAAWLRARYPEGAAIGIALRSEPRLVIAWLAVIAAGLRPLILQYPTAKQTRDYWRSSVLNTVALVDLAAVIGDERVAALLADAGVTVIDPDSVDTGDHAPLDELPRFSILQLSSGTTGHRKAVAFTDTQLERHVRDFNAVLALDPARDHLVSWLPLYHDMGYLACFVMPLLLGVPVTTLDPETWVADKPILFDAIAAVGGTHCYMPNFGFETLAQATAESTGRDLSSMRRWVSCSEPVLGATARRFLAATGCDPASFSACYAMAENVFAVSLSDGLVERDVGGVPTVSCGPPIAGVEIKTVDGELWVKSPASLERYVGGDDIRDGDGFYPTGDMGTLIDGEVHVTGRRRDVLIQAGRKFMLSAIDAAVNAVVPEVKGRAAAVVLGDDRIGTEKPVVLIEAADFIGRHDAGKVADAVRAATGLDFLEVHFVPPRFLTKTSSGKINRIESARHWVERGRARASAGRTDPAGEIARQFGALPQDAPVGETLDSLSLTLLKIVLADTGTPFRAEATLAEVRAEVAAGSRPESERRPLRIVSLADRRGFRRLEESHLLAFSKRLGVPVSFEHLCLPPTPILLSDLIFLDYFAARLAQPELLQAVSRQLERLRAADVILLDDAADLHFPLTQTYPVLSHRLERSAEADLLAFRWQRYVEFHHQLPVATVPGDSLPIEHRATIVAMLSDYLATPIFRIGGTRSLARYTEGWEYRPRTSLSGGPGLRPLDPAELLGALAAFVAPRLADGSIVVPKGDPAVVRLDQTDLAHFCSHPIGREALDAVLSRFDRFCIVGQTASVAYLRKRLAALGKAWVDAPSYHPSVLAQLPPFDCLLACGPTGKLEHDGPAVAVMTAGWRTPKQPGGAVSEGGMRGSLPRAAATEWFDPVGAGPALAPVASRKVRDLNHEAVRVREARRRGRAPEQDGVGAAIDPSEAKRAVAIERRRAERRAERRNGR